MWTDYINYIEKIKHYDINTYITCYAQHFQLELYSFEKTIDLLGKSSTDLFPERKICSECLNSAKDLNLLLSLFLHWDNIDWKWLFINSSHVSISECFNPSSPYYIYNLIGFYPELLLSKDDTNRTLTYLFLYFLPESPADSLLYHYDKNIPLLTFHQITMYHFEMLIYLMKKYDQFSFENYCSNYNFNHLLVENFLENSKEICNAEYKIIWENILPIKKIKILLDSNCSFINFLEYRQEKNFYTFEELPNILYKIEKDYFFGRLDTLLKYKEKEENIEVRKI